MLGVLQEGGWAPERGDMLPKGQRNLLMKGSLGRTQEFR